MRFWPYGIPSGLSLLRPHGLYRSRSLVGTRRTGASAFSRRTIVKSTGETADNLISLLPSQMSLEQRIKTIHNIRDLSEACPTIIPGKLIRCGKPSEAGIQDAAVLLEELNIKQLIDLRATDELQEDEQKSPLLSQAELVRYTRSWVSGQVLPQEEPANDGAGRGKYSTRLLKRHNISLLERSRFYVALLRKTPLGTTAKAIGLAFFDRQASRQTLLKVVNDGALVLLYQILLDTSQPEFKAALDVVLAAAERQEPAMFFCKAGKDRTGLLAAMILSCCGATDKQIVADYVRSDAYHQVALAGLEKKEELNGLDRSKFERAPAEAMEAALAYVRNRYGSMSLYMDKIGFSKASQEKLARCLTVAPKR